MVQVEVVPHISCPRTPVIGRIVSTVFSAKDQRRSHLFDLPGVPSDHKVELTNVFHAARTNEIETCGLRVHIIMIIVPDSIRIHHLQKGILALIPHVPFRNVLSASHQHRTSTQASFLSATTYQHVRSFRRRLKRIAPLHLPQVL